MHSTICPLMEETFHYLNLEEYPICAAMHNSAASTQRLFADFRYIIWFAQNLNKWASNINRIQSKQKFTYSNKKNMKPQLL